MKELIHLFNNEDIIFKNILSVCPKKLKSKKKLKIYSALDIHNKYHAIFEIDTKSRFIMKNAKDILLLLEQLKVFKNHNYKYRILWISSAVCSKTELYLLKNNWKIFKKNV